jgi:hypothetical protein
MVFEGFYVIYGSLLPIWMGAVGWNLYRLGRRVDRCRARTGRRALMIEDRSGRRTARTERATSKS